MLKKIPIRLRFTLLAGLLLAVCCIGLTLLLNFTAYNVVDQMDAVPLVPAITDGTAAQEMPAIPTTPASQAKWGFSVQSILYMLLTVIGGSGLTYYISGKALKPLIVLNEQVKNRTVHNLSESLPVPAAKDEIWELTISFNEMTDKLNEAFLMQQRFSASAAHELKTPLAVLQTKVDVFKKHPAHTTEDYEELITVIHNQTYRLRKLVGTLLDMTNENGEEEMTSIHLGEMLDDITTELAPLAADKDIHISLTVDEDEINGNIDLLYRALYNLVENSIKYNVIGGAVRIAVRSVQQKQVEVVIADTGIGIADAHKKHIFEPFYRIDKSRSREMGGAGLGLSFVEHVVKKHGGSVTISDNQNGGSCFQVLLNQ